jgi:hypothetical protein
MPVIISRETGAKGLGEERAYPISTKVNSVKNDDAG